MIPTRGEIQDKIDQIRRDRTFSTIKSDKTSRIEAWLDSQGCPEADKEKILDDLVSYQGY